jgi:chemotaxis response regulator CheB
MMDGPITTAEPQALQAVLIGGSAGALEVVYMLLDGLPRDFAQAVAIVLHQPRVGEVRHE